MILLLSVLAGLVAGTLRARLRARTLTVLNLRYIWLVLLAFLPQWVAFQLPATRQALPVYLVAAGLVSSQLLLFIFAWLNRRRPGVWLLGLGLVLNLAVIGLNGGLMPVSPETVAHLVPNAPPGAWQVGERLGWTKDIVLPVVDTHLWWLSDRFTLPGWVPYKVAFSPGDVLISAGAFWLLWSIGGRSERVSSKQPCSQLGVSS